MLQQANNSQSQNGFGIGGRPNHSHWYGFSKRSEGGRNVAQCLKCNQLIRNTAAVRMQAHREKCPIRHDNSMTEESATPLQLQQSDNDFDEESQLNEGNTPNSRRAPSPNCLNESMFDMEEIVECKQEKLDNTLYTNHWEPRRMDMMPTVAVGISAQPSKSSYAYRSNGNEMDTKGRTYEADDHVSFLNHLDSILRKLSPSSSEILQAKIMVLAYEALAKQRENS